MVLTTFKLSRPGLSPPIYLAGTFTQWEPLIEMDHDAVFGSRDQHVFSKVVDIEPGEHQFKFRLGHGDWWIIDDETATATDESGNVNNVVHVFDTGEGETKNGEVERQSASVKEERPSIAKKMLSKDSLASSRRTRRSEETVIGDQDSSSARSILNGVVPDTSSADIQTNGSPKSSSKTSPNAQGMVENVLIPTQTDGSPAAQQEGREPATKSRANMFTTLCSCFTGKMAVGVVVVSAVLVAFYIRK